MIWKLIEWFMIAKICMPIQVDFLSNATIAQINFILLTGAPIYI